MFLSIWKFLTASATRWIVGALVTLLTIYGTFFFERKPDLAFEIVSSSNVLDIRESITKLSIAYSGTDLRATNQNLHLLVLRIVNTGATDILKASFDDEAPLGFEVNIGKIVEGPSVIADNYLKDHLHTTVHGDRTVTFAPVILNAGESFQVRTLLLVPENQILTVTPVGKIAGVRAIHVVPSTAEPGRLTYVQEVFGGRLLVQVGRLVGYFFGFVLAAVTIGLVIGVPTSMISDRVAKARRVRRVQQYRDAINRRLSLKEEFLATQYINNSAGYRYLLGIVRPTVFDQPSPMAQEMQRSVNAVYDELESNGLIVRDGPQVDVNPDFSTHARDFVNFVTPPAAAGAAATGATHR